MGNTIFITFIYSIYYKNLNIESVVISCYIHNAEYSVNKLKYFMKFYPRFISSCRFLAFSLFNSRFLCR